MTEQTDDVIDTGQSGPSIEDRAKEMGWRPLSEFKGDESRFVDAETFVKKGEEVLPIIKANARKAEAELADMRATFAEFKKYHSQTEQRAYQRAIRDLEER